MRARRELWRVPQAEAQLESNQARDRAAAPPEPACSKPEPAPPVQEPGPWQPPQAPQKRLAAM